MLRRTLSFRPESVLVVAGLLATTSLVHAAGPRGGQASRPAAPARKKPARPPKPAPASTAAPLTAEALGLTDTSLASIMAERSAASEAPALAPPPPPPPPVVAPPAVVAPEPAPPPPSALVLGHPRERDAVSEPPVTRHRALTVGINPLPIVAGRYGLDVVIVPSAHHALYASGYWQTFSPRMLEIVMPKAVDVSRGSEAKLGGELGYRWYSSRRGAHGLFVGAAGVAMPLAFPRIASGRADVASIHAYGGALDVGAQVITGSGFTIGGGLGAMYLAYTPPPSTPPPGAPALTYATPHVLPRLLLTAGWSF